LSRSYRSHLPNSLTAARSSTGRLRRDTCCGLGTTVLPLFHRWSRPLLLATIQGRCPAGYACQPRPPRSQLGRPRAAHRHTQKRLPCIHQSRHSTRKPSSLAIAIPLLPPRSARAQPPHASTHILLRHRAAPLPATARGTRAPPCSIFCTTQFGRYVGTRFLAAGNFHAHRPAVPTARHIRHPHITHAAHRFAPARSPCLPQAAHSRLSSRTLRSSGQQPAPTHAHCPPLLS
jgi:hypothetical protein